MKSKNKFSLSITFLIVLTIITGVLLKIRVQSQVKDLFRMNKVLQEEGYYMAEFEFRMLGFAYYLDRGSYFKALSQLSDYHKQLQNKNNLIKIPEFKNKKEELEFYLNLQNPRTGAFMDDSAPYCTFNEPTENVISHIDALAKETGVPLKLKYPLKYLDSISTPEKLCVFLEDVSDVGWIGAKFPQTSYVFARSLLSYWNDEGVIGINHLYNFSPEYKAALLGWFCNNQDSITGYWGPRSRKNGRLLKLDLNNTASIIKSFVNDNGDDINEELPLKYRNKLIESTLKVLSEPVPANDELDELHEWNLKISKGIKMLLRYLWKDASVEEKQKTKALIESYIQMKFEKYYIPEEGAFSYYPGSEHASLDGTEGFIFSDIGAFDSDRQNYLWGDVIMNIKDLGQCKVADIKKEDLQLITNNPEINSVRIYHATPDYENLTDSVYAVFYPAKTPVPDIMEFVPKIIHWLDTQSFSMGNWSSKEAIRAKYISYKIKNQLIFKEILPIDSLNNILSQKLEFFILGFDKLQIPRYKILYLYTPQEKL